MALARGGQPSAVRAFLLGIAGAVAAIVLMSFIEALFNHPMRSRPIGSALLLLVPFVMAFAWCAVLRMLFEAVKKGAAPAGYASVFALLGLLMAHGDAVVILIALIISVLIMFLGYLGEAAVTSRLPGRYRHEGLPTEPVCPRCGYGLYYVRDHLCPDCGEPFRSADVDMRLARWEEGVLKPLENEQR